MADKDYEEGFGTLGMVFAFFGGAVAGAAAAMLLAPKNGEETRRQIKTLASSAADRIAKAPEALKGVGESVMNRFSRSKDELDEIIPTRH